MSNRSVALAFLALCVACGAPDSTPTTQTPAPAPAPTSTQSNLDFVTAQVQSVDWGQYMAQNCIPSTVAGWDGFPTVLCRYHTGYGDVPVVLLDANSDRLARWLVSACQDAGATLPKHCAERLALRVKCQSGNQFPVAGFVDEGPLYFFRDGITVSIGALGDAISRAPTTDEEALVLGGGTVSSVHKFARVAGTTREEFAAFQHLASAGLDGLAWQGIVRAAYQRAWASDHNELISAWAKANLTLIDHKLAPAAQFDTYCQDVARTWRAWPITDE